MEEFVRAGAPVMDFVFIFCDNALGEACPIWPGQPTGALGTEDPAALLETDIQKEAAFDMAYYHLEQRISLFRNLPLKSLGQLTLGARLREIGQTEGATSHRPHVA